MFSAMKEAPDVVTEELIDVACSALADLLKQYLNEPSTENRGECDEQVEYMSGLIDDIYYNAASMIDAENLRIEKEKAK